MLATLGFRETVLIVVTITNVLWLSTTVSLVMEPGPVPIMWVLFFAHVYLGIPATAFRVLKSTNARQGSCITALWVGLAAITARVLFLAGVMQAGQATVLPVMTLMNVPYACTTAIEMLVAQTQMAPLLARVLRDSRAPVWPVLKITNVC